VRIGLNAGSTGNVATVDGATSTWTMTGKLRVGSSGDGNALDLVNGGQVTVASDVFVGGTSTGSSVSNNAITVRGTGSTLTIQSGTADLVISFGTGTNNRVTVADGGTLAVSSVKLGPGGTLAIGSGSAVGTVSPGAAIDAPFGGGRLDFNHTDANYQFANPITGSVSVLQRGPGKTVITGTANSYTGNTTVAAGTLAVTGAASPIATSGTVDVAAGAVLDVGGVTGFALGGSQTLAGSGTVSGAVQAVAGSIIAPGGAGLGTLAFDSSLAVFGTLKLDVSGTAADSISVAGPLTLDAASVLDFTVGAPLADQAFTLALYSTLSGTFGSLASLPSGYTVDYNYLGGNAVALVPVPEPTTLALLAAGGCCAVAAIRRRRSV
jgi:T5SS/PEP-CTERM-associated repeat protein/autotransporter-associated beta strand protein